ncbi:hypothetical protein QZN17_31670 [Burkholderia multivorans]|nr:hypothetical protein [Burkholderia multivorans]
MDEREMFEATLVELTKRDEETFDKPFPNDDINVLWAIWKEARRTTPDRDAIRNSALDEAAAAVGDHVRAGREWIPGSLWDKLTREATARIRALKTTPTAASREEGNG